MKIGIVGLGLIGGSLGLDLCDQGFSIFGVSRQEKTCRKAEKIGAVNRADVRLSLLVEVAVEIIFICTPIDKIVSTIEELKTLDLNPETLITDVGSVKSFVVRECSKLWPNFVGGHPMAGTEKKGIEAAQKGLFAGATYILTPDSKNSAEAVDKLSNIAELLGSTVSICSPQIHDRAVAWISHLPVIVSASLIDACLHEHDSEVLRLAQQLASSGFRDTSRVGGGNPELGVMMARYNRQELLRSLAQYRQSLDRLIEQIEQEDWRKLEENLKQTQGVRHQFLA
jgi:arogenate dehydrogenase (NADP+)